MSKPTEAELDRLLSQPSEEELDKMLMDSEGIESYDPLSTGLKVASDVILAGHYPQVEATLRGNIPGSESYIRERDRIAKELQKSKSENPWASAAGMVGGIGGSIVAPALSAPKAVGTIGRALFGVGSNLASQFLQNPGDVEGQVEPLQLKERAGQVIENVQTPIGAITTLTPLAGVATKVFKPAEQAAFEALGPTAKKAEKAMKMDKIADLGDYEAEFGKKEIGKFALENKLVSMGDTVKDTWNKAVEKQSQIGAQIGDLYQRVQDKLSSAGQRISNNDAKVLMNPYDVYGDIEDAVNYVNKSLGPAVGRKQAVSSVQNYLTELQEIYPENPSMQDLMEIRGKIANRIKDFSKDPSAQSDTIVAYRNLLKYFNNRISSSVDALDRMSGSADSQELKRLNEQYSKLSYIADMTGSAAAKADTAKQGALPFILSPATWGGAAYGATQMVTGDPIKSAGAAALIGGGAAASKLLEGKGAGVLANLANQTAPRTFLAPTRISRGVDVGFREDPFIQVEGMVDQALMNGIPPFMIEQEVKKSDNLTITQKAQLRQKAAKAAK